MYSSSLPSHIAGSYSYVDVYIEEQKAKSLAKQGLMTIDRG